MKKVVYPSAEKIIEFNLLVLTLIKIKKSDKSKVISFNKITETIEEAKLSKGDTFEKAATLLHGIIRKHPFESGNRRTAFIVAKYFLSQNHSKLSVEDSVENARVLQGIRENFYKLDEITEWLRHGKIRKFQR